MDTPAWRASSYVSSPTIETFCYDKQLLGGFNILGGYPQTGQYFERTYTGLAPHSFIRYVFNIYILDTWDGHYDRFAYSFDGVEVTGWGFDLGDYSTNYCGTTYQDLINMKVYGTIPHTASSVTFRMIAYLDEPSNNESFGFRDLYLLLDGNLNTGSRQVAYASITLYSGKQTPCADGTYFNGASCSACHSYCQNCYGPGQGDCYSCKYGTSGWDGNKCVACDGSCITCFGTASNQCGQCVSGYYYFSWTTQCFLRCPWPLKTSVATCFGGQCTSPCAKDQYVYWDSSCSSTCAFPLVEDVTLTVIKLCKYPCSDVEYLYWDGTCQQDCAYPLTVTYGPGNMKYCNYICGTTNYLYWDGTCKSSCASPLISKVQNSRNFCLQPCPAGQYLYWNNDCMDTCGGFLSSSTVNGVLTCSFPCSSASFPYLYWNGSCYGSCGFPLRARSEKGELYCDYPGPDSDFMYWDSTSETGCSLPLLQRTEGTGTYARKYCDYKCALEQYLYWDGTCGAECVFPLTQVIQKGRQFCTYTCTVGSQYLYWDGSCQSGCVSPLSPRNEAGYLYCDYPCDYSEYLYSDGSCSSTCDSPFTPRTTMSRQFCDFPCSGTTPVWYSNSTCRASCGAPLVTTTKYGHSFCSFPCADELYLYTNGSCLSDCNSPFFSQSYGIEKYCGSVCSDPTDFYYWNGSCLATCSSPFTQYTISGQKWCLNPCRASQFIYPDDSCQETCEWPLVERTEAGIKYCFNECPGDYVSWNGSCLSSCDFPLRIKQKSFAQVCLLPCDDPMGYYDVKKKSCQQECTGYPSKNKNHEYLVCLSSASESEDYSSISILDLLIDESDNPQKRTIASVNKLLQHIRYVDMDIPLRLQKLIMSQGKNILSLRYGQVISSETKETFAKRSIPAVFEAQDLHSEFLVNFWHELTSWMIVVIAAFFVLGLEGVASVKSWNTLKMICSKLRVILAWNFCLILIATSVDEIVLFAGIEFMSLKGAFGSSTSVLSFEVCLVIICTALVLLAGTFFLSFKFQKVKENSVETDTQVDYKSFLARWQGYQALYNGFRRSRKAPNYLFYFFYIVRLALPMVITCTLYTYPLIQTILFVIVSVGILAYIFEAKPLIRKINFVQLALIETTVLLANVCLLILKLLDNKDAANTHKAAILGDIIVCANAIINILIIAFFLVKLWHGIKTIFIYQMRQQKRDWMMWLQLIVYYLQQGGFGFEEIFIDEEVSKIFNHPDELIKEEYKKEKEDEDEDDMTLAERERLRVKIHHDFFMKKFPGIDDSPIKRKNRKK